MATLLAFCNLKGGVGKSHGAVNVACELAQAHKLLVTLIDADSQGTAAHHASAGKLPVAFEHWPLEDERAVDRWVQRVLSVQADYVVIDAPPHFNSVTKAIVAIADTVVIPCSPSGADLAATIQTLDLVRATRLARTDGGPGCLLVPSRVDRRTVAGREIESTLNRLGEPVGPAVHQRAVVVESFTAGQWIGEFAPNGDAHEDIATLTKEIMNGQKRKRKAVK